MREDINQFSEKNTSHKTKRFALTQAKEEAEKIEKQNKSAKRNKI